MFMQEYNIARSEHQARNAKLNNRTEVEGITVTRPSLLERALAALRGSRSRDKAPVNRPVGKLAHGAAAR